LYRDYPERVDASSTPTCCNCQLAEGEAAHPANYHGCSHAKEQMWKKKPPRNIKNHNQKGVLLKFYNNSCVICSGAPRHPRAKE
jgi:hypothetical protein